MGTDALFLSSDFDEIGNKFVESIKGEEEFNQQFYNALPESMKKNPVENVVNKIGLTNSFDVTIGFSNEWKADGTEEGWTMSVSIATKKNLEVDAEIVNFNVEKAKRLFKLEFNFKEKQVKGDFMGLYFGAKD
jgi:hypothetical protein